MKDPPSQLFTQPKQLQKESLQFNLSPAVQIIICFMCSYSFIHPSRVYYKLTI